MSGENIAAGQITPEMVVNGWMNSEGHKRNILDSSFKSIGIGCVNVNGLYCWVQCFGRGSASEAKAGSYSNKTSTRKVLAAKGLVAQAASFKLADTKLKVGESTSFKTLWGGSELKNAGAVAVSSNTSVCTVKMEKSKLLVLEKQRLLCILRATRKKE